MKESAQVASSKKPAPSSRAAKSRGHSTKGADSRMANSEDDPQNRFRNSPKFNPHGGGRVKPFGSPSSLASRAAKSREHSAGSDMKAIGGKGNTRYEDGSLYQGEQNRSVRGSSYMSPSARKPPIRRSTGKTNRAN